jgi:hypothetical protein
VCFVSVFEFSNECFAAFEKYFLEKTKDKKQNLPSEKFSSRKRFTLKVLFAAFRLRVEIPLHLRGVVKRIQRQIIHRHFLPAFSSAKGFSA